MSRQIRHTYSIIICCAALLGLNACVHQLPGSKPLQTFHDFRLDNGIKVTVRHNPMSRVHAIVLYLRGGTAAVAPEKAGLDRIALQLMCMASERYTDSERREILKQTASVIEARNDLDFATIHMQTIDVHFARTFDLYLDLMTRPAFPQKLFEEQVTNALNAYRSSLTDGYARVSRVANQAFFNGHPYEAYLETPETLSGLTLQDMRDFYRSTMVAQRLTVFASGNFNVDALREQLNATIGSLPRGNAAPAAPGRFARKARARLLLDSSVHLSPDASYLRGNVATVPPQHADYWPLQLAGKILTDIMNDILRTRNALVYSTWAGMHSKQANYASLSAYRTSDPLKTIELITAAVDMVAQGKCVSPYSQKDLPIPGTYIEIDKALGFYRQAFSTEYYAGMQDNTAVALRMAAAHNSHGDSRQFLASMDKVNQVSARDISRVVKRYLKKDRIIWALSAHPDTIADVKNNHRIPIPEYENATLP